MSRAQCIVHRGNRLLMVKHRLDGEEWWCLPGGAVEDGETQAKAALRELREECSVSGTVLQHTSTWIYTAEDHTFTYLVDIGDQEPRLGADPELGQAEQVLADMRWLALSEIPERDRAFLWAAGLLSVEAFCTEVERWGDRISYPGET